MIAAPHFAKPSIGAGQLVCGWGADLIVENCAISDGVGTGTVASGPSNLHYLSSSMFISKGNRNILVDALTSVDTLNSFHVHGVHDNTIPSCVPPGSQQGASCVAHGSLLCDTDGTQAVYLLGPVSLLDEGGTQVSSRFWRND